MKSSKIVVRLFSSYRGVLLAKNPTLPLVEQLDINVSKDKTLPRIKKTKIKLNKGLESKEAPEFTPMQLGTFETAKEEILEVLENCLGSNELLHAFHSFPYTSKIVQIKNIQLNRDISHIDVFWESNFFEEFIQKIYEVNGETEGKRMKKKLYKQITETLQKKEGKFRTYLMREIFFRRVPRIFFRATDSEVMDPTGYAEAMEQWGKEELERQKKYGEWVNENSTENVPDETTTTSTFDSTPIIPPEQEKTKRKSRGSNISANSNVSNNVNSNDSSSGSNSRSERKNKKVGKQGKNDSN